MGLFDPMFGKNQSAISGLGMGLLANSQGGQRRNLAEDIMWGMKNGLSMQQAKGEAERKKKQDAMREKEHGMSMFNQNNAINQQQIQNDRNTKKDEYQSLLQNREGEKYQAGQNYANSFNPESSLFQTPGIMAGKNDREIGLFRQQQGLKSGMSPKEFAPPKQAADPTSVREFQFAKQQGYKGGYQDFLQSKKGNGMSMTLPDGTTMQMGGKNPALAPPKSVKTSIFKDILAGQQSLDSMAQIKSLYEPEFLTYYGAGEGKLATFLNKMNPDIKSKFQARRAKFISSTNQEFLRFRKWATGVAGGEKEMAEIKRSIFSEDDSPQDFEAKLELRTSLTRRLNARAKAATVSGVDNDKAFKLFLKENPLDSVPSIQSRGDELTKQGYSESQTLAILKQEGYI